MGKSATYLINFNDEPELMDRIRATCKRNSWSMKEFFELGSRKVLDDMEERGFDTSIDGEEHE